MEITRRSSHAGTRGKLDAKRWEKATRFRFVPRLPTTKCIYGDVHERKRVNETHFAALTIASVEEQVAPPRGAPPHNMGAGQFAP